MNKFIVKKASNTYADSLEAYGLCKILHLILTQINANDVDIVIRDYYAYYEITLTKEEQPYSLSEDSLSQLNYFPLFKFIKQNDDTDLTSISEYYDYDRVKKEIDAIQKAEKKGIITEQDSKKKQKEKRLEIIGPEYNVISLMARKNQYANFHKLYFHFHSRQKKFVDCVKCILSNYSTEPLASDFEPVDVNKLQLYNPSCGKGANHQKAKLEDSNIKGEWISSALYISGAQTDMICSFVKKGTNKSDVKIVVPVYSEIKYGAKEEVINEFRKKIRGSGSIQTDILNALYLTETLLQRNGLTLRRRKIRSVVSGLQIAYQMASQNVTSVTNIGFIGLPGFVSISKREENNEWIKFIQEHIIIISDMTEKENSDGLSLYRDFISDSNLDNFHAFTFWYASHVMAQLSKNKYIESFSTTSLNQLYLNMETNSLNLKEIVNNAGLQAIADAIRASTVSIQRTDKNARKYEVRYGLAHDLQIASNSKEDLATFIADFAMTYNAETARVDEKDKIDVGNKEKKASWRRGLLTKEELDSFYTILSNYSSTLIGGLLGAYGFSRKPSEDNQENKLSEGSTNNE